MPPRFPATLSDASAALALFPPLDAVRNLAPKQKESFRKATFKRCQARLELSQDLPEAVKDLSTLLSATFADSNAAEFVREVERLKREVLTSMVELKRAEEAEELAKKMQAKVVSNTAKLKIATAPKTAYEFQKQVRQACRRVVSRVFGLSHVVGERTNSQKFSKFEETEDNFFSQSAC